MPNHDDRWSRNLERTKAKALLKEKAVASCGGKCQICGYDQCFSALDFHHTDPEERDFIISSRMNWAAIEIELKKCVLLCSNCHREVHAGYHPTFLVLEDEDRGEDPYLDNDDV